MYHAKRTLFLSGPERLTLEQARDHHPKPYVRERAAALLYIAAGRTPYALSRQGLLKAHKADTLYRWLNAYARRGLSGLYQFAPRPRGFSPSTAPRPPGP